MNKEIPIFFSTDNNYILYLDIALKSLIENASKEYQYRIIVLNTGLDSEGVRLVKQNEREGFTIDFIDISPELENIKAKVMNYRNSFGMLINNTMEKDPIEIDGYAVIDEIIIKY